MQKGDLKKFWNKLWFIVWKDDSLKGWIISIIFLFVLIKFIFFPLLSLITGTTLPLAIVESCSMYHDGNLFSNYNEWFENTESKYTNLEITKGQFSDFIFKKGFNKGDILFIVGANPDKLEIGDIIIFNGGRSNPLIHRIINIEETGEEKIFSTIGDNNAGQLETEIAITESQLVGKAVFKLAPYLGWVKLVFFEHSRPQNQKGFCN